MNHPLTTTVRILVQRSNRTATVAERRLPRTGVARVASIGAGTLQMDAGPTSDWLTKPYVLARSR